MKANYAVLTLGNRLKEVNAKLDLLRQSQSRDRVILIRVREQLKYALKDTLKGIELRAVDNKNTEIDFMSWVK
jgi:hypothetical protein